MKNNITSNRDYATENINLRQQIINLQVANKDKAETIKSMKQELIEYSELRDRFKVLYEENQKYKQLQEQLGCPLEVVFKALKEGIWFKSYDFITKNLEKNLATRPRLYYSDDFKCYRFEIGFGLRYMVLKDYKKTWWLVSDKESE